MTYKLSIAEAAEVDLRQAFLWYENQKENLGVAFEEYILNAINSIQSNPLKVQVRYGNTRVYFLKKFPYGIHFQVTENKILIVAVFHTSQSPELWMNRGKSKSK